MAETIRLQDGLEIVKYKTGTLEIRRGSNGVIVGAITITPREHVSEFLQAVFRPERGDAVEAWIKKWRDTYRAYHDYAASSTADDMLDDYRLHSDAGVPLDRGVTVEEEFGSGL